MEKTLLHAPHNTGAEQSVLGGLMLPGEGRWWDIVSDILIKDDFYRYDHALIFEAIASLNAKNAKCDFITVSEHLDRSGKLSEAGGFEYLVALSQNTPSAANIESYAKIVKGLSAQRELLIASNEIGEIAKNPEGRSAEELIDAAEAKVFNLSQKASKLTKGPVPVKEAVVEAIERIDALFESGKAITGIPTGLTDFDAMTSGMQPSDLIILAARPSMGKTSFAMGIAEHAAINENVPTLVFSMEMPKSQLAIRMLSSVGRIDSHRMRTGKLDDSEWPKLAKASRNIIEKPIFIDDTSGLTPTELRSRARRLQKQHGLGLIVIDYLQLMRVPNAATRAEEISEISRQLKSIAKELNVPVIALSQLNRELERRPNKRPVNSDLRESGSIEQDADLIVFLYRDEVYNQDSPDKGVAEIIIGKQRNGPIGTVKSTWVGQYTRFENYSERMDSHDASDYGSEGYYQP